MAKSKPSAPSAPTPPNTPELGAPIAPNAIDPDLIKLSRSRIKVGIITAAGLMILCGYFLIKLQPDRVFAGAGAADKVVVADVLADKVAMDQFIALDAEPLMAHAIRTMPSKGNFGFRVAPVRGTGDKLWLVIPGDSWEPPTTTSYIGRLRRLDDLVFAPAVKDYAAQHPRPVFATVAAVRAGLANDTITTISGDHVSVATNDQVAFDIVDPNAATIVAALGEREPRLPNAAAWVAALTASGITPSGPGKLDESLGQVRFDVAMPVAAVTSKLEAAKLWAARVDVVLRHYRTTWGAIHSSAPTGFTVGATTIPDAQLDLIGLYVARSVPSGAYALLTSERPADYWYVLPITIGLAVIGSLFGWALVRSIRRDLLPVRP